MARFEPGLTGIDCSFVEGAIDLMQDSFSKRKSQYFGAVDALLPGQGFADDFHFARDGVNPRHFLDFDRNVSVGGGERRAVSPLLHGGVGRRRTIRLRFAQPTYHLRRAHAESEGSDQGGADGFLLLDRRARFPGSIVTTETTG